MICVSCRQFKANPYALETPSERGRGTDKLPVIGAVERGGKVVAEPSRKVDGKTLAAFLERNIDKEGTLLVTDEFAGYNRIGQIMNHAVIQHTLQYVDGLIHTNTIEGFWALLKRAWYGTHHHYSDGYALAYAVESCYKYNNRGIAGHLCGIHPGRGGGMVSPADINRLYYGDNLTIMAEWPSACVDLIYLDPPFNSNRQYNAIYKDETGRPLPDQIEAFCDMWELDEERERAIRTMPVLMREAGIDDAITEFWRLWMQALRGTQPRLLAYLSYMAQRLLIMHRILKPTGSLYLHCDPTASHYTKALLDAIFGHDNFQNDIVWQRYGAHNDARRYGRVHDNILYYSKPPRFKWTGEAKTPYSQEYIDRAYRHKDERGRYTTAPLHGRTLAGGTYEFTWRGIQDRWRFSEQRLEELDADGLIHWPERGRIPRRKVYLDEDKGVPASDVFTDISPALGAERMGYHTQKPLALLERIVAASTDEGDTVLDPFCGCATTLEAAHKLGRKWIGIDIAIHAVKRVASIRLTQRLGLVDGEDFVVEGVPRTVEGAQDLWQRDPYHFQKWAVEQSDGFVTTRRSADGGVDGRIYFAMPHAQELQSMVIEVKGGQNVNIADVRALAGVLDHDAAIMAGLIVLHPPAERQARNFTRFMAEAGTLEILGIEYPRLQLLAVADILDGRRFQTPTVAGRHEPQSRLPGIPR